MATLHRSGASRDGRRVVVIGAGMAGLTALDRLSHAGFHVTVVEARARAGGRVRTAHDPFADGMYADLGAAYVVDCHPHVLAYVDRFDLPLQIVNPRHLPSMFHLRGRNFPLRATAPIDWPVPLTATERQLGYVGMIGAYLGPSLKTMGAPALAGWPDRTTASLDRMNGVRFLQQAGASRGAIELLGSGMLDVYGDGMGTTSALFLLAQQKLADFQVAYTIRGGMERLPAALAAGYHHCIEYGAQAVAIDRLPRGVRVTVRRCAGAVDTVDADYCVAALPYAALRRVRIRPALPPDKRRVVTGLSNTSVLRAFVQCRERFWEGIDPSGTVFTDVPGLSIYSGFTRPATRGLLEGYFTGAVARSLGVMSPLGRRNAVLRAMRRVFPTLPAYAETVVTHFWDHDPWARGAYAWYRPGELVRYLPHLANPEGRLHFAGDHTSLVPGWMEGAIESGIRAADEIAARA